MRRMTRGRCGLSPLMPSFVRRLQGPCNCGAQHGHGLHKSTRAAIGTAMHGPSRSFPGSPRQGRPRWAIGPALSATHSCHRFVGGGCGVSSPAGAAKATWPPITVARDQAAFALRTPSQTASVLASNGHEISSCRHPAPAVASRKVGGLSSLRPGIAAEPADRVPWAIPRVHATMTKNSSSYVPVEESPGSAWTRGSLKVGAPIAPPAGGAGLA